MVALHRVIVPERPLDLWLTLGPLARGGRGDPSVRMDGDEIWRATRTPAGIATQRLRSLGQAIEVEAWGPGAEWLLEHAPVLVGDEDDDRDFAPSDPILRELHRRHPGLRMLRTEAVMETLLPTVLEQKVVGVEARQAYRQVIRTLGEPAPGPTPLMVPPAADVLARTPYWTFHGFGVERRRTEVIQMAAQRANRLEALVDLPRAEAYQRLLSLPGIGPWSAAEIGAVAFGDPDAVSVGDYHLPHLVSWVLLRQPRGSDELMLELLEPYRGHRARVIRLLMLSGLQPPRYGPRLPLRRIARH
jgi:3-methyladenine DNA glycosylase/8-oxoguanine DNA glycosylase